MSEQAEGGKSAYEKLYWKHRLFVDQYFLCNMVAWKAYVAAGYGGEEPDRSDENKWQKWYRAVRANSARMIAYDNIQAAIAERMEEAAMAADEVLYRLAEQGRNPQMQFLKADGAIDLEGLIEAGLAHLVKGTKFNKDGRLMVEFYDAQAAIREIGKAHGIHGAKGTEDDPQHVKIIMERVTTTRESESPAPPDMSSVQNES